MRCCVMTVKCDWTRRSYQPRYILKIYSQSLITATTLETFFITRWNPLLYWLLQDTRSVISVNSCCCCCCPPRWQPKRKSILKRSLLTAIFFRFAAWLFPSTRRRGAVSWKDAAFFIILLLFWVRRNFAIFAAATSPRLLFFRVHNPSWLRAT